MMKRKTWMLASALLLATACNDDNDEPTDSGQQFATVADSSVEDASPNNIDSGSKDAGIIDAFIPSEATPVQNDASREPDASTGDASTLADLSILGNWYDGAGYGDMLITNTMWGSDTLIESNDTTRVAVAKSSYDNKYSKYVWTALTDNSFYYCTVGFGGATVEEARAFNTVDVNDLDHGCGASKFPWSKMRPAIEIAGTWSKEPDQVAIDSSKLDGRTVVSYDNNDNSAVTTEITTADSGVAPTFNKIVWAQPTSGQLYLCVVAKDLPSATAAENDNATADSTQTQTGCLGGPWTALTK